MKKKLAVVLGLISLSVLGPACALFNPTTTKTYILDPVVTGVVDKSLGYRPGVVKPTTAQDIEFDKTTGLEAVKRQLLVTLKPGETDASFLNALNAKGIKAELVGYVPTYRVVQLEWAEVDPDPTSSLVGLAPVSKVQRHFIKKVLQSSLPTQAPPGADWYLSAFDIPSLWKQSRGEGVTIATLDTGLDLSLPTWTGRVVGAYSVITQSAEFQDVAFNRKGNAERVINHGTQVAFMAAGSSGVAPKATLMPIQVVGYNLVADALVTNDLTILEGLSRAMAFGAKIINISLGTDLSPHYVKDASGRIVWKTNLDQLKKIAFDSSQMFTEALEACETRKILVVCAAGNDGLASAAAQPLAASGKTVVVGALGRDFSVAPFSNRGSEVDCYAPGMTLNLQGAGGSFWAAAGTSFAAPYVAGILALGQRTAQNWPNSKIKEILKKTNFEGRSSILGKSVPIFFPGEFLVAMGLPVTASQNLIEEYRKFYQRYSRFFVNPGEDGWTTLEKIVGYYSVRRTHANGEPEFKLGLSLAPRYHQKLIDAVIAGPGNDYYAATFLAEAKLSDSQLSDCLRIIPANDFGSFVASFHGYRPAVPLLIERLKTKYKNYNSNTLSALKFLADASVVPIVLEYLAKIQERSALINHEALVAAILAKFQPDQHQALILSIYSRYKENYDFDFNFFFGRNMVEALEIIKAPEAAQYLAQLIINTEGLLDPQSPNSAFFALDGETQDKASAYLDEVQRLLNPHLPQELKYIKTLPIEIRRQRLAQIAAFLGLPVTTF